MHSQSRRWKEMWSALDDGLTAGRLTIPSSPPSSGFILLLLLLLLQPLINKYIHTRSNNKTESCLKRFSFQHGTMLFVSPVRSLVRSFTTHVHTVQYIQKHIRKTETQVLILVSSCTRAPAQSSPARQLRGALGGEKMTDRYPTDKSARETGEEEGINSSIPSRFLFSVSLLLRKDSSSFNLHERRKKLVGFLFSLFFLSHPLKSTRLLLLLLSCWLTLSELVINTESIFTLWSTHERPLEAIIATHVIATRSPTIQIKGNDFYLFIYFFTFI